MTPITQMNEINEDPTIKNEQSPQLAQEAQDVANMQNLHYTAKIYTQPQPESSGVYRNNM